MTERPRKPGADTAGPPPLPKPRSHPASTDRESTAPRAAPPPRPRSRGSDEDNTKHFANLPVEAELVVVEGEFKGKSTKLAAGTVVIGRSSECDLVLKTASGVSRKHAKVQFLGNRFVVVDLESRNGTIVNGQSVERKVLENGDKIEIGDEVLQFVMHSLADVRDEPEAIELSDLSSISQLETAVVPQTPQAPRRAAPPSMLPETLPPTRAPSTPSPPPLPASPPPPPPMPAAAPRRGNGVVVFAALAGVVIAGGAFLAWDLFFRPAADPTVAIGAAAVVDAGAAAAVVDAGAAAAVVDAGAAAAVVDAGAAAVVVDAVVDAGAAAVVVDAGAAAVVVDAGAAAVVDDATAVIVRAKVGGRCESVVAKPGDVVDVASPLVIVAPESFNLRKKLETLRVEAAEFEGVSNGAEELAAIRREMKSIEARLKPQPLVAGKKGTVIEVLVKPGDVVRDGAPLAKLAPAG